MLCFEFHTAQLEKKFLSAAASGDLSQVKKLRIWGVSATCKDTYNGLSALHLAARNGKIAVIEYLLQVGVGTTIKNNDGSTPLFGAAEFGQQDAIKFLIKHGAVDANNKYQTTALHHAARNCHLGVVALLVKSVAATDTKAIFGSTPLHDAASINSKDKHDRTPLHKAAWKGSRSVVEVLLMAGASLDSKDKDGKTPLQYAREGWESGHKRVVELLETFVPQNQPNSIKPTAPSRDSMAQKEKVMSASKTLNTPAPKPGSIEKPSIAPAPKTSERPPSAKNLAKESHTPTKSELYTLVQAINDGNTGEVFKYIELGVDLNTVIETGDSLLHLAIKANQDAVVDLLLSIVGINTTHRQLDPLLLAIKLGYRRLANQKYVVSHPSIATIDIRCRSPYIVDVVAISREENNSPKLTLQYMECAVTPISQCQTRKKHLFDFTSLEVAWVVANALADLQYNSSLHREAPEVLRGERYDYAADIYSFGVILSELDTLELPYFDSPNQSMPLFAKIREGLVKPSLSSSCEPWLKDLALMCLAFDPAHRPSAHGIVDFLRAEMRSPNANVNKPVHANKLVKENKPVIQHSYSSTLTATSSSHSEFGLTLTLSKWTQIPCPKYKSKNHITAPDCVNCSAFIRSASDKLGIMLK
ncbi:ankyrin repeat protein [Thraustotheca clavata]|uniref:Ankyrin repeat protein n=1 Tax=Thraustotheca clavata TaxID=74557 RepID=A0A1V9YUX7_9STRA|nr:ankyrin repeat protein [Thraustotheca clavata]